MRCRTLRGCVDWNIFPLSLKPIYTVAPFAGAWIEINHSCKEILTDWVAPFAGAWIEIIFIAPFGTTEKVSHPSRVRGLKSRKEERWFRLSVSHPSRVRGLKLKFHGITHNVEGRTLRGCVDWNHQIEDERQLFSGRTLRGCVDWNTQKVFLFPQNLVAPFAGAWIEIKNACNSASFRFSSHPSRVRGLKLADYPNRACPLIVAPFAGAWIEIFSERKSKSSSCVAPFAGAWIEMWVFLIIYCIPQSHPSRGRGLKL